MKACRLFICIFCYDFGTFFTFFSKINGFLKNVLLKMLSDCGILHPNLGTVFKRSVVIDSDQRVGAPFF